MTPQDFLEMIKSSTSAQRAIANAGEEKVERQILELANSHVNNDINGATLSVSIS